MHHIAAGDASLKIQGLRLDLLVKVWYNEIKKGGKGMPHGYKREYNDIFYFRKDHFCPECKTKLEKVPVSKVVIPSVIYNLYCQKNGDWGNYYKVPWERYADFLGGAKH